MLYLINFNYTFSYKKIRITRCQTMAILLPVEGLGIPKLQVQNTGMGVC